MKALLKVPAGAAHLPIGILFQNAVSVDLARGHNKSDRFVSLAGHAEGQALEPADQKLPFEVPRHHKVVCFARPRRCRASGQDSAGLGLDSHV